MRNGIKQGYMEELKLLSLPVQTSFTFSSAWGWEGCVWSLKSARNNT